MPTFYEDSHGIRDVLYAHDPEAERRYAEADAESIEKILDHAVGAGRIQMSERTDWRDRLRAEPELAREILESLPADREYAEKAALRDPRLALLAHLSEVAPEEARTKRAALDADLAVKRDHLAVLRDALPEIERRRVEEEQAERKLAIRRSGDALAKRLQGRYNAAKNFARALASFG
jgi:hypothetical protein